MSYYLIEVSGVGEEFISPTTAKMTDRICEFLAVSAEWLAAAGTERYSVLHVCNCFKTRCTEGKL